MAWRAASASRETVAEMRLQVQATRLQRVHEALQSLVDARNRNVIERAQGNLRSELARVSAVTVPRTKAVAEADSGELLRQSMTESILVRAALDEVVKAIAVVGSTMPGRS
jgi:hypothetical protein